MVSSSFQSLAVLSGCVLLGTTSATATAVSTAAQATDNAKASTVYLASDCRHAAKMAPGVIRRANGGKGLSLDSCSGDVYMQRTTSPALNACATVEANGFYLSYIPCSKGVATAGGGPDTTATAMSEKRALQDETPGPTPHVHSEHEGHTPAPTVHDHANHEGHTPSPAAEPSADGSEGTATDATDGAAGSAGGVAAVSKAFLSCAVALGAAGAFWVL